MAGEVSLARNAKFFVSTLADPAATGGANTTSNTFQINALSGYSLSQSVGTEEISLSESGCSSCRSVEIFNTNLDPAQISLSTYIQPYDGGTEADAVERILWNGLVASVLDEGIAKSSATMTVGFSHSQTAKLLELYLFVVYDDTIYRVSKCQVNSCDISFDINNIAQMTWELQGSYIELLSTALTTNVKAWVAGTDYLAIPDNKEYINAKLSTMKVAANTAFGTAETSIPLTGGNLVINNNLEYLTPEELSVVSKPAFGSTGALGITGSVNAYLKSGSGFTGDLLAKMLDNLDIVQNSFDVTITIGGCDLLPPYVVLNMPFCHLGIPTIDTGDVIGTTIGFNAQPSVSCGTDMMTAVYHPTMVA